MAFTTNRFLSLIFILTLPYFVTAQDTYNLNGDDKVFGRKVRSEMVFSSNNGSMTLKMEDQVIDAGRMQMKGEIIEEVFFIDPHTIEKKFINNLLETATIINNEPYDPKMEIDSIVGQEVRFEKQDSNWVVKNIDQYPDYLHEDLYAEAEMLEGMLSSDYYPRAVKIGESWELEGQDIRQLLGLLDSDDIRGKAILTLEAVEEHVDDLIAKINVKITCRGVTTEDGLQMNSDIKFEMNVDRSLKTFVDKKVTGIGKMIINVPMPEEQPGKLLMSLDFSLEARQLVVD